MVIEIKGIKFSIFDINDISEIVFFNLLNGKISRIILCDTNVLFHSLFNKNARELLKDYTIIPTTKVFKVMSELISPNKLKMPELKDSKIIFHLVKHLSEYPYLVTVISESRKSASRFKDNVKKALPNIKLNILGIYKIFRKKEQKGKLETLSKLSPNLVIFDSGNILRVLRFIKSKDKVFAKSSIIITFSGVEIISGSRSFSVFEPKKIFLFLPKLIIRAVQSIIIIFWAIKNRIWRSEYETFRIY